MKDYTYSIPNVHPLEVEGTIKTLRTLTLNSVKSWSYTNGVLNIHLEICFLLLRGKIITRIVYHDKKSWVAQYEFDDATGRWLLVGSRGDWLEKLEGEQ